MGTTFCGSAHTRLIDKPINNTLHTATDNLFTLAGIQPPELLHQKGICL